MVVAGEKKEQASINRYVNAEEKKEIVVVASRSSSILVSRPKRKKLLLRGLRGKSGVFVDEGKNVGKALYYQDCLLL